MTTRVLLIDDDVAVRTTMERLLTSLGYSVQAADGAMSAVSMFVEGYFDVVVSDYRLLDSNGLELLQKIRDLAPATGTVIVSGLSVVQSDDEFAHADEWLQKPVRLAALQTTIQDAIEKGHARSDGLSPRPS
ncbi:MAG: response regulator [Gemmatimonadetes bacterium]|nr:response regulator [Gemmatimonadota bacterium]MBT7860943.1 response regulator [Gemmatimonadota bacterium]